MPRKVVIVADPGIDTAFAIALALHDPNLDVIGLIPCAGNVSAAQAAANVQVLIDQLDPPKWPRTAAALPVEYEANGTALHGADGLGGINFPVSSRHQQIPADKVLAELIRENPREVALICLGPVTTVARAFDRDPELPGLLDRLVLIGGAWKEPGNAGPVSEFHFYLDPESTRRAVRSGAHPLIIPLDVTRRLILSPSELLDSPNPESKTCQFLRKIVPFGIRASSHLYGIEGFHLKDVLGIAAVALPGAITAEDRVVDIETKGDLTRGMMVVDARRSATSRPNALIGVEAAVGEIRQYINRILTDAP
ncbi:nucleoside hydrolase [Fimbriiglobus ruber]|uniref:Inosine-uridine preferring nucleoside hydrolase n=1 Tax=Fimbriiglobus ruber TaxID=1908690 RepID=A0A225DRF0_9BACT|nr:nucleoside hydrolase [Fimbriiglobus ruber]OWK38707.1 Inosine-uridine preferring nucleoside hydrolase [Fimbriiglobus ruber]